MGMQIKKLLEKRINILFILWFALLTSTCFIVAISYIKNKSFIPIKSIYEILLSPTGLVFLVAGFSIFAFSMSLIQLLIKKMTPLLKDKTALIEQIKSVQIKNGKTIKQEEEALLNELSLDDVKIFRLFISYLLLFIIRLALAEAITIIGLQVSIFQQSFQVIFPFFALSLIVFISKIPKFETIYSDLQTILRTY
jgi:hypothetical protein